MEHLKTQIQDHVPGLDSPDETVEALMGQVMAEPSTEASTGQVTQGARVVVARGAGQEAMRQMGIAAADRQLRAEQGLPPPSADLR